MPRKRAKQPPILWHTHFMIWTWGLILRNPWKALGAVVAFFAAIVPAVAGYNIVVTWLEPVAPAWHEWVRDVLADVTTPLTLKIQEHDAGLDYLILKDQHQALKDAQEELTKHPDSGTAQEAIDRLQKSIKWRSERLDKETEHSWRTKKN